MADFDIDFNWDLCFLCQEKKKEKCRSTVDGIVSLSTKLWKFHEVQKLSSILSKLCSQFVEEKELSEYLKEKTARYHHNCSSKYNDKHFQKAISEPKRDKKNESNQSSTKRKSYSLGSFVCCFCDVKDAEANLHAAGTFHAKKKKVDSAHVQSLTETWREMATFLLDDNLLAKLSTGDLASNEMYYHGVCYKSYVNKYESSLKVSRCGNETDDESVVKAICKAKIAEFMLLTEKECPGTFFQVKSLEKKYLDSLTSHGIAYESHTTRFSESMLAQIDGLQSKVIDKKLVLYFESTVDNLMKEHLKNPDSYSKSFREIVTRARNSMARIDNIFSYSFHSESQVNSVPMELACLISGLVDGIDIDNNDLSQEALSAAQQIMYNFRLKKQKSSTFRRHSKHRETPLSIYIALKMYTISGSKTIIECLHKLGICISYDRLLDITKHIAETLLQQFEKDGVFLPGNLKKNSFTIIAKDNVDINAKSSTATRHFHGTSMSIMQFPHPEHETLKNIDFDTSTEFDSKRVDKLPDLYARVGPIETKPSLPFKVPIYLPVCTLDLPNLHPKTDPILEIALREELNWLEQNSLLSDIFEPWSSYHSKNFHEEALDVGNNSILPLIDKEVHLIETQYHCMSIIKDTIEKINPYQVPVDVCDQPVYALSKEIQIRFHEKFGPGKYFVLFGALHIEKSFLMINGDLINGTGLDKIFDSNDLSIVRTGSLVSVSDIKTARYCIQVSVCALYVKLKESYSKSCSSLPIMDWVKKVRSSKSEMCAYLDTLMNVQLTILTFVRSLRIGDFNLYKSCIRSMLKFYFALDHVHYARWMTVHYFDLLCLEFTCPDIYQEFVCGNFSYLKTKRKFSRMAPDQLHEQNNEKIKGSGGATHLLNKEDESGLIKWELCGPELLRLLEEFEHPTIPNSDKIAKHHEDTKSFKRSFSNDVQNVIDGMSFNPFDTDRLTHLDNENIIFEKNVSKGMLSVETVGKIQLEEFWKNRMIFGKKNLNEKIKKNNICLASNASSINNDKEKIDIPSAILSKLDSCIEVRKTVSERLFSTELFGICHSLAKSKNKLYHGKKSDILPRFERSPPYKIDDGKKTGIIIELSAAIQILADGASGKTFGDFSKSVYNYIERLFTGYQRCDVVCDRYVKGSVKDELRLERGTGSRKVFNDDTNLPSKMRDDFLRNDENKEDLNSYLAEKFITFHKDNKTVDLIVTKGSHIISCNEKYFSDKTISMCTSEEADARMVRHVLSFVNDGFERVIVRTVDTDVVVLLIGYMHLMRNIEVIAHHGVGKNVFFYDIRKNFNILGNDCSRALPFQYAFSGCDTTSSFFKIGKCRWLDGWLKSRNKDQITSSFLYLTDDCTQIDLHLDIIEQYVKEIYYSGKTTFNSLENERMTQFYNMSVKDLKCLPPSRSALIEHLKRTCFQVSLCWKECKENVVLPDVHDWGRYKNNNGVVVPKWQTNINSLDITEVVFTCTCRKSKCVNCKCSRAGLQCLRFCKCQRDCSNN